jgi:3',5'-cyclic AMP phosphodiesterase CpdA
MFVLAHLSDPHLGPMPRPRLGELASKRLVGYVNWYRSRRAIHSAEALAAILVDLRSQQPDHVAVTGDLINIALPAEFERAAQWLAGLGAPDDVSLVPGNHDAYVAAADPSRERYWAPYMTGDRPGSFPYVRRRGPVALVGLSTAVATPLLMATGRLGPAQIARTGEILAELHREGRFRVIMIHHPPDVRRSSYHKRLVDAPALCQVIAAAGAELLIHGHDHVREVAQIAARDARIPILGVPSASATARQRHAAGYNLYRIDGRPGAWRCEVVARGLGKTGTVAEIKRFDLSWSGSP